MRGAYRTLATISPPRDRGALLVVLQAAVRAGGIPRDLGNLLKATLELPDLRLRNAMVPRVDVVAIPEESSVIDAAQLMAEHGRQRLPVFHGTIDQPTGILHALDVAHSLATNPAGQANPPPTAGQLVRPALSLSHALPLLEAIRAMQTQAARLVLVMDERGGLAGLATLEDLVEQLLGPIQDEYGDEGRDAIRIIGDGVAIVGAAAGLHEIERALDVRFPAGPFVSIGGLVYERLGRVPQPGDVVQLPGVRIEVLSVEGVRLRDLRVRAGVGLGAPDSPRLELRIGREVVCGTEVIGSLDRLVVEPTSGRVSHIVLRRAGRAAVVPLEEVEREDDAVLYLRPYACERLDKFSTYEPEAISRSTELACVDGPVGKVRHMLLDRTSGAVTHVVVRVSHGLLISREVVVPLSWARSITAKRIELAANRDDLLELPEFRPDDEIAIDVLRRLDESPFFQGLDRYTARVEVDGGVVRLFGRVRTSELKRAAEEVAASVPGALSVDNQLIADDALAASVEAALQSGDAHLEDLEVSVLLGRVRLRGKAATPQDRRAAEQVARAVTGVESVANDLEVKNLRART